MLNRPRTAASAIAISSLIVSAIPFAQETRLPVIDVHAHTSDVDSNGPPSVRFCPGEMLIPGWDQAGPPWPGGSCSAAMP